MSTLNPNGFLQQESDYTQLLFYKKTVILYDLTFFFKERYLQKGDRTQDQMEQAARSGKQNIAEGMVDGMTSVEMMLKLLNVARGSLRELKEDYEDYLRVHKLPIWDKTHPRYDKMVRYCYSHHETSNYSKFFERWSEEELCNTAITHCHQADRGLIIYMKKVENSFLEQGGIREKMSNARRNTRGF